MKNSIIKKVFSYVGKYNYFVFLSTFCAVVSVLISLYIPILFGKSIDCIAGQGRVDFSAMIPYLIKVGILVTITAILQWIMNVLNNKITFNVVCDMRNMAFSKIQVLPFEYLDSHSHGETISRVISDSDQFADGLLMGFTHFFTGVVTIIGTLAFMIYINFWIAIVVVILTPMSFFITRFIARKTYKMFKLQSKTRGEQTSLIEEMVTNQNVTQAYNHKIQNQKKFDCVNDKLERYSLKATFFSSITNPSTRFVNAIVYAAVVFFGAILVVKGNITIGILSSFLAYATQYSKPFNEISGVVTELQNSIACAGRLFDLIEEREVKQDLKSDVVLSEPKGDIRFKNVDFSYVPDEKLIKNLNVDIHKGMKIAIVGPTGSGKTTIINLLMKFYDANSGDISIDKINYDVINVKSLRSSFGMVLQDTWLKSGTIFENLIIGKPNASMDEVVSAAKKTHSHSFIMRLPNGYETFIDSDGGNLSQGQKQLLCITRLMLVDPPMLILDEATSNIDTRTEIKIQRAFAKLMKDKTTFIVAHRLSTIKNADLILVMNKGTIVEKGTHASLLANKGFYYKLYNSQFNKITTI